MADNPPQPLQLISFSFGLSYNLSFLVRNFTNINVIINIYGKLMYCYYPGNLNR